MKPTLLVALSFVAFLTNLPLTFSIDQVRDIRGNGVFPGLKYNIFPAFGSKNSGGGLKLAETGLSNCPLTLMQNPSRQAHNLTMRMIIPGISTGIIFTGTRIVIKVIDTPPPCAASPDWLVYLDPETNKAGLGIGGPEGHPGQTIFNGTFHIEESDHGYRFVFCVDGLQACSDVGLLDPRKGEDGRRLNLTRTEPFEFEFIQTV